MVKGRPLPPRLSATVSPDRRLQAMMFNLRAVVLRWRPLCSSTAGSRCIVPTGRIPGGDVVDCAMVFHRGGEGAGPYCVLQIISRVLGENCVDLVVIFYLFWVPDVICIFTNEYE